MTQDELIAKLETLFNECEARIVEVDRQWRENVEGIHPAFLSGQRNILVTVCVNLEALLMEAKGRQEEGM